MTETRTHTRVNQTILQPFERPALQWLAARMPAWVTPDLLTGLGVLASILIFVSFVLTNKSPAFLWLASLGVVLNWFGDSLDGTLARYRHIERPQYGFFIDHSVDAIDEVLMFLGVGLSPYVRFDIACLALISYMLLSIYVFLTTYIKGVFRISYARLGPTEMRAIMILSNIVVFFVGNPQINLWFGPITFYSLVTALLGVAIFIAYVYMVITTGLELSTADRLVAQEKRKVRRQVRQSRRKSRKIRTAPGEQTASD